MGKNAFAIDFRRPSRKGKNPFRTLHFQNQTEGYTSYHRLLAPMSWRPAHSFKHIDTRHQVRGGRISLAFIRNGYPLGKSCAATEREKRCHTIHTPAIACLVVHLLELELRRLEAGHGPPASEGLDVVAQSLHLFVVLRRHKRPQRKTLFKTENERREERPDTPTYHI